MSLMETDVELHHTALAVQRLNLEWSQKDKGQVRQIQVSEDSFKLLFLGPEVRAGVGGDGSFQNHLGFVNSSFLGF